MTEKQCITKINALVKRWKKDKRVDIELAQFCRNAYLSGAISLDKIKDAVQKAKTAA